jgi:hypothetical protein
MTQHSEPMNAKPRKCERGGWPRIFSSKLQHQVKDAPTVGKGTELPRGTLPGRAYKKREWGWRGYPGQRQGGN